MNTPAKQRRAAQLSLRSLFVFFIALGLLFLYTGTYYRLSRRGMREAEAIGLEGFLYVPFEDARQSGLTSQRRLIVVFAPANFVDRLLFGGSYPTDNILFSLE